MEPVQIQEPYKYGMKYIGSPVPVDFSSLPPTITIAGEIFTKKKSFHVSLMYTHHIFSAVASKMPIDDTATEQKIISLFNEYIKTKPIAFKGLNNVWRMATCKDNKSIVACCEVENLHGFFDLCKKEFNIDIPYQPTHITVYTLIPNVGIGINAEKVMDKCQVVDMAEIKL